MGIYEQRVGIRDDDGKVTYEPYIGDRGEVGYKVTHDDGRVEFIYLNASGGSDDGVPTVFVYFDQEQGAFENAVHHYEMFGASDGGE